MKVPRPSFRALCHQQSPLPCATTARPALRRPTVQLKQVASYSSCIQTSRTRLPQLRAVTTRTSKRGYAAVSAADLQFGQPVYETHSHILQPAEITPGITAQEYADRRAALAHSLTDSSIAILHAAPLAFKSGAVFHPYRQESNFLYLTGWNEPEAVAIIRKTGPNLGDYLFTLFVKPKDPREEQWNGYRNGVQAAEDIFNADEAYSIDSLESMLPSILGSAKLVYTDTSASTPAKGLLGFLKGNGINKPSTTPLYPVVNKLRVIKSPAEVTNMRLAGQISGRAITNAMRQTWTREKDLHAYLDYQFTSNGCDGPAYIPVIAGGERANCIHYTVNNQVLEKDKFVLIDAGGEYGTYITDISRTWPVSGRFTDAQRDLYNAVLNVQRSSVSLCRASSKLSLEDIHHATVRGLVDQLKLIGFDSISMSNIGELFPHHVGHYIGLDVHDCPGHSRREKLVKGHCVTIEPGIYVPDDVKWPAHFRGMGVRIEDSVCVDEDSPYILSTEAVKEVADIEALR